VSRRCGLHCLVAGIRAKPRLAEALVVVRPNLKGVEDRMNCVARTGSAPVSVPVAKQQRLLISSDAKHIQAQTQIPVLTLVGVIYLRPATAFTQFVDLHCLLIQDLSWAMQVATEVCKVSWPAVTIASVSSMVVDVSVAAAKQAVSSEKTSRPIRNEGSVGI